MTLLTGGALTHTPSCPQQLQACAQLMQSCVEPAGAPPKKILSMPVDGRTVLKEYSSLQDNQYNVRYIHTVLIVHNYFAPRGVVNVVISESSYCSAHALGHTHINDITGPAAGLAWADKVRD